MVEHILSFLLVSDIDLPFSGLLWIVSTSVAHYWFFFSVDETDVKRPKQLTELLMQRLHLSLFLDIRAGIGGEGVHRRGG